MQFISLYLPSRVEVPFLASESYSELLKAVESIEQILVFGFNAEIAILYSWSNLVSSNFSNLIAKVK